MQLEPNASDEALLAPDAVQQVRASNTRKNLQSNFWYDIANYTRWLSTASFMGGLYLVGQSIIAAGAKTAVAAGAGAASGVGGMSFASVLTAAGAAIGSAPFLAAVGFGLVLATATVITSKHSRKLFVDKNFDVQDFQMQRQAALVGQSVEKAFDEHESELKSWSDKSTLRPHGSHIERLAQQEAQPSVYQTR